jgi:DNA repair photolyase
MTAATETTRCRSALSRSSLPGLRYSLNPYVGCGHGCLYCYAPSTLGDEVLAKNWGRIVRAKENVVEVLGREVLSRERGTVGVSTVTDPYQPLEGKLELTRRCIGVLAAHGFPVSIQTKSSLVLRDIDLISPDGFDVGVTITTMDRELAGKIEPGASPPDARAQVLNEFSARGVKTWLFLGPVIPGVNDSEDCIRRVVEAAAKARSALVYDRLNLRRWVMDRLGTLLDREFGGRERVLSALSNGTWWRGVSSRILSACRELGVKCEAAFSYSSL